MKVSHGFTVYGARRCNDARARGVRSMVRRDAGEMEWRKVKEGSWGVGKEDGGKGVN